TSNIPDPPGTLFTSGMNPIVGKSLTDVTVRTNELLVLVAPSLTRRLIVAVPDWLLAGTMETMRLVPAPSIKILAFGTKLVFEELPVTESRKARVSTSLTVNGIVTATSSGVARLAMLE